MMDKYKLSKMQLPFSRPQVSIRDASLWEEKTKWGTIRVEERFFRGHRARLLFVNDALQSAVCLEEGERGTLLFPYLRGFDWALRLNPGARKALLIGGGGFVYADHFLEQNPDCSMDVLEFSKEIIRISGRFFFLKEIEKDYGARDGKVPRFRLLPMEAMSALLSSARQYDLIFNDAFLGRDADRGLLSFDGIALTKARLNKGGIYMINMVTAPKGWASLPGRGVLRRISSCFRNTALLQADESRSPGEKQNCLLIASDRDLTGASVL